MNQKSQVKQSFESAAKEYNNMIPKIIPFYEQQQQVIQKLIKFPKEALINILDLGVGTGNLAKMLLGQFPNAKLKGIDMAQNMIDACEYNLKPYNNRVTLECHDFSNWQETPESYDIIIADLSVHHLQDMDKQALFNSIYKSLNTKGLFLMRELVKSQDIPTGLMYLEQWISFMESNDIGPDNVLRNHREHDLPSTIEEQIEWLSNSGFTLANCPWHYLNFAILLAQKL